MKYVIKQVTSSWSLFIQEYRAFYCLPLNPLQEALKLPKQTPEEKAVRDQALQAGLQEAAAVPYNLAMEVNRLWPALVQLATVGNLTTISDLQVGSQLAA